MRKTWLAFPLPGILVGMLVMVILLYTWSTPKINYKAIEHSEKGVFYIPIDFPNPWDELVMEDYTTMSMPLGLDIIIFVYYLEVGEEVIGSTYALVYEPVLVRTVAAAEKDEDGEWTFWIYPGVYPKECTKEEQEHFLESGAYRGDRSNA